MKALLQCQEKVNALAPTAPQNRSTDPFSGGGVRPARHQFRPSRRNLPASSARAGIRLSRDEAYRWDTVARKRSGVTRPLGSLAGLFTTLDATLLRWAAGNRL